MFRPRRTLLATATIAGSLHTDLKEKLPIYPQPEAKLVLIDTPSDLERQIGAVRRHVTSTYLDGHSYVQSWVSKWVDVEHRVENRVKSLIPPDENLTPGALYVGVAALTGSVLARQRGLFLRFLLPPTLFVLSMNHFLPKTTENISDYIISLEREYVPRFAQTHETAIAHSQMTWEMAKEKYAEGRDGLMKGTEGVIGKVQEATGLKLKETFGWGQTVVAKIEAQGHDVVGNVEERGQELAQKAQAKVEALKDVAK